MNTNERLSMITKEVNKREAACKTREAEEERKTKLLMAEIQNCKKRIDDLLEIANALKNNGIDLPKSRELGAYGYSYDAYAEGFYHGVGLMGIYKGVKAFKEKPIEFVGYYNGGACGPWNFYTNGTVTFMEHENTQEKKSPTSSDCQRFLEKFNLFEKAFYEWFDNKIGKEK